MIRPEHGPDWNRFRFDMSAFDGQKDVQVRLKLRTSNADNDDGVYLDNIRVEAADTSKRQEVVAAS